MDELKNFLCYLATPYSKYPDGLNAAFVEAAKLTGKLVRMGIGVYSPIAHTHPIALYSNIDPYDHSIWLAFDQAMMDRCDVLVVVHMEGWEQSKGIAFEVEYFHNARKPIYDLDPATMELTRRAPAKPPRDRIDKLTDDQLRADRDNFLSGNG